jgi:hypothetical protein
LGRLQDGLAIHDEALLFVRPQRSEGIQRCAGAVIGLALPLLAPSLAQAPSLVLAPPSLGLAPSVLASSLLAPPLLVLTCS